MGERADDIHVHLVDGTYELFRHYFGAPSVSDGAGRERGAVVGVVTSVIGMLEGGATHVGVATDHVIESFRNELYPGYKTGDGIEPDLLEQFHPLEDALSRLGVAVWPMIELEADDGMASAAAIAARDPRVTKIFLCTPDKDLAQCVRGDRIVQLDRRKREIRDHGGVEEKFGVPPSSIPDYLALVGDSADGFPGVKGWGPKSAAAVLARFGRIEDIPDDPSAWEVDVRGRDRLAERLSSSRADALLFKRLATVRTDAPLFTSVDEICWRGPRDSFAVHAAELGAAPLAARAAAIRRPG